MEAIIKIIQQEATALNPFFSVVEMAFHYTHLFVDLDQAVRTDILAANVH